ncbi:hypothetical protein GCM10028805_22510 [Spirosoma harenae]
MNSHPRTLTEAINQIRDKLVTLEFTDIVQGRAMLFDEKLAGQDRSQPKPMVHVGNGEYLDCRPNDTFKSVIFFASKDLEKSDYNQNRPSGHAKNHVIRSTRNVSLYGWVNMKAIPDRYDDGSGFPELIKMELKKALQNARCVTQITGYQDGQVNEVFKPFIVSDLDKQYDKWPYCAFRIDLAVLCIETNVLAGPPNNYV